MPSYEQRGKNKQWSVRFRETDLDTGDEKNVRLTSHPDGTPFKTKREAQAAYHNYVVARQQEFERRKLAPAPSDSKLSMTFGKLTELFFESLRQSARKSSLVTYTSKYEAMIKPYFADKAVVDITPADIVLWQSALLDKGYKYNYLANTRTFFNSIWRFGEMTFDFPNVARKVKGFRNTSPKRKDKEYWTKEQVQLFLDHVVGDMHRMFFKTLYITGCRRGELFALSYADLIDEKSAIRIDKSLSRKVRPWEITEPKNASSYRDIPLDPEFYQELKTFAREHNGTGQFIFTTQANGIIPLSEKTAERKMEEAIIDAGLPRLTMHGLRHSCASLLVSEGVSIAAVSAYLGHENVQETLNTYSHLMPNDTDRMRRLLSGII